MYEEKALTAITNALRTRYGEPGVAAARLLQKWISGDVAFADVEVIARHLDPSRLPLVYDAFRQNVPFGTGGQRGPVGYGPNRINPANLAITVQGHCDFLRAHWKGRKTLSVVVACDVREFRDLSRRYAFLGDHHPLIGLTSRKLGQLACEIYAANGIVAHFPPTDRHQGTMSTPEMAFLIRHLKANGGIQLSASHNPPDDNGLKIYNEFGSQPIAPEDELLAAQMKRVTDVRRLAFDDGLARGLIKWTSDATHEAYLKVYTDLFAALPPPDPAIPVVYAPLNGCGLSSVGDLLNRLGFKVLTPPGEGPDGSFSAVPLRAPNPEVAQATQSAIAFAEEAGATIVLSSDPDVDRVGLDIKLASGAWHHFDGNQIAAVLCRFLMLDPRGPQRKGLVIETFVTTRLLGEIAQRSGAPLIDDLPVGMKYVANVLNELEKNGRSGAFSMSAVDFAFAAEESHGVIVSPEIREKDAAPACMYLAILHQILQREGRTLLDYYVETLGQLGSHETVNRSLVLSGADGAREKDTIMESLRKSPPKTLAGKPVRRFVDFWDEAQFGAFKGETDRLSRNSLQIFTDNFIIAIRPSGTEPKLKIYCQLLPSASKTPVDSNEALARLKTTANQIAAKCYNQLLKIVGRKLSPAALALPDIIDVNEKTRFDLEILPELHALLPKASSLDEVLQWLQKRAATMIPGADPLPALRDAIHLECARWQKLEANAGPRLTELSAWSKGAAKKGGARRAPRVAPLKSVRRNPRGTDFFVVSANCGAAARAIALSGNAISNRVRSVGEFIQRTAIENDQPVAAVVGLQELGRFETTSAVRPDFQTQLNLPTESGGFYYVDTLSTETYPLKAKWQVRWDENVCHGEQGVAACALHGATLHDPEQNAPRTCDDAAPFRGAVIDLPVVTFLDKAERSAVSGKPWRNVFTQKVSLGGEDHTIAFRFSRYLGNRDTEPRIATAHRVTLDGASDRESEFVFINLHLTTLREQKPAKSKDFDRSSRAPSPEAEILRHFQLSEVCDFIWTIYESDRLPVVVAGDFNTSPDRPDLARFLRDAGLKAVFHRDRCWACGGPPLEKARAMFTNEAYPSVLTTTAEAFADLTDATPQSLPAREFCSRCARPLFTHKRNFQLVDNILYTDGNPAGVTLRSRILFDAPEQSAGVGVETYFSDHFPIWSRFRLTPG